MCWLSKIYLLDGFFRSTMIFWTSREERCTNFKWILELLHSAIHSTLHTLVFKGSHHWAIAQRWMQHPDLLRLLSFWETPLPFSTIARFSNRFSRQEPSSTTAIRDESIAVVAVVHIFRPSLLWRWPKYDCLLRVDGRFLRSHLGCGDRTKHSPSSLWQHHDQTLSLDIRRPGEILWWLQGYRLDSKSGMKFLVSWSLIWLSLEDSERMNKVGLQYNILQPMYRKELRGV